jgi:phosphoglycolate phosphatase-like HAD superfamily hydrolase
VAEKAVIIGDTPVDVEGGLATGVRVIAVAYGKSSEAELSAAGAVEVLTDLRDTGKVLLAVHGRGV